jgi:hypothetical protein
MSYAGHHLSVLRRWLRPRRGSVVVMAVLAMIVPIVTIGASAAQAAEPASAVRTGFNSTDLGASDDDSSGAVPLGFAINFFGNTFSGAYVNNNGNLTFGTPLETYTPFDLSTTSTNIIAPFFADVDTLSVGSTVHYGAGTVNEQPAFGATFGGVGCYNSTNPAVVNDFQVILISRADIGAGDFDIEFNYNQIVWDAGTASGGNASCLGGSPAHVGYSNGTAAGSFELPGSGTDNLLDGGTQSLTGNSLNSGIPGRYDFAVRNGAPLAATTLTSQLSSSTATGSSLTVLPSASTTDAGTLSGETATAGGTATYTVYSDSTCLTSVADGGTVPVTNGAFGTSSPVTLPVGTYYWQVSYSGDAANNAAVTACGSTVLQVAQQAVTITADNQAAAYGGTVPPLTHTVSGLPTGTDLTTNPTCTVASPHTNAGAYSITCSGADAGPDYAITYVPGTLTVSPAAVVVTADNQTRVYGAADPAFTYETTGLVGSDDLTTNPTCTVAATHDNSGSYPITCSGADAGGNYTISYQPGTLTVLKAVATVTPDSASIVFGHPDPAFTYSVSGLVGSDTLTTDATCTVQGAHSDVGMYLITCSGADAGGNYTVAYGPGTLSVSSAAGQITADPQTVVYGNPDPAFTYSVSGLVGSDTLTTDATCTVQGVHSDVGTYPITCSGADAGSNYTLSYVAGTLTVTAAPAVIVADNQTKVYGSALPALTYSVSGLVNGDALTTDATCTVQGAHSDVGTYPITCSGADAGGNYTLTYAPGALTITQAPVVVAAPSPTATYGTPASAILIDPTFSGLVNGDSPAAAGLGGVSCTTTAAATTGGSYPAGTSPVTCSGPANTTDYAVSYLDGTLTIAPAVLTVTADDQTRAYDTATVPLRTTITGLVNGDDASAFSGSAEVTTTAMLLSPAGTYPITPTQGTLAAANYTFAFVPGTLTITNGIVVITETSLPDGTSGVRYNTVLHATGGLAPYVWAITAGSLPAGLSLNPKTGAITGTPSGGAGKVRVTIRVTDSEAQSSTTSFLFTLAIAAAPVRPPSADSLAFSGADISADLTLSVLLLITGACALILARRRRSNQN